MDNLDKNGVYSIKCKSTNKLYIGSTANKLGFKERWKVHKTKLRNQKHSNSYLQKAWNKYGEENFEFSILEICEKSECIEKEQKYLDEIQPFNDKGFNLCKNAGNTFGRKHSKETRKKISANREYGEPWNKNQEMDEGFREKVRYALKNSARFQKQIREFNKTKRKPVIGIHKKTKEVIELEYMSQDERFHASGIKAAISGKIPSYKGYYWSFR